MPDDEIRNRIVSLEKEIALIHMGNANREKSLSKIEAVIEKLNAKVGWGVTLVLGAVILQVLRGAGIIQ